MSASVQNPIIEYNPTSIFKNFTSKCHEHELNDLFFINNISNDNNLGLSLGSQPSSLHRHLKYPISNYSCPAHFPSNFSVDRFLLPNTAPTYPQFSNHRTDCHVDPTNPKITSIPPPSTSSVVNPLSQQAKRKRSWSRAVFSQLQRKGLEIQFQIQKYITKPDRRKLAARLGLTDAQVLNRNLCYSAFVILIFYTLD